MKSSGPLFKPKAGGAFDAGTYRAMPSLRMADVIDLIPDDGTSTGWLPIRSDDITAVDAINVAIEMQDLQIGTLTITSTPRAWGCGSGPGASDTYFIRGGWTKLRYRQTFYGTASCYGIFGSQGYHYANSSLGGEVITVNGLDDTSRLEVYSVADNGLFEFDPAIDRFFYAENIDFDNSDDSIDTVTACHNGELLQTRSTTRTKTRALSLSFMCFAGRQILFRRLPVMIVCQSCKSMSTPNILLSQYEILYAFTLSSRCLYV